MSARSTRSRTRRVVAALVTAAMSVAPGAVQAGAASSRVNVSATVARSIPLRPPTRAAGGPHGIFPEGEPPGCALVVDGAVRDCADVTTLRDAPAPAGTTRGSGSIAAAHVAADDAAPVGADVGR